MNKSDRPTPKIRTKKGQPLGRPFYREYWLLPVLILTLIPAIVETIHE
jgi:hypothetical protein